MASNTYKNTYKNKKQSLKRKLHIQALEQIVGPSAIHGPYPSKEGLTPTQNRKRRKRLRYQLLKTSAEATLQSTCTSSTASTLPVAENNILAAENKRFKSEIDKYEENMENLSAKNKNLEKENDLLKIEICKLKQKSKDKLTEQEEMVKNLKAEIEFFKNIKIKEDNRVLDNKEIKTACTYIEAPSVGKSQLESPPHTLHDQIDTLHRKVSVCVRQCLDKFYLEQPEPKNIKIADADEYTKYAKHFSHKMRAQIKDTYEEYNRTLEGITLTLDNKEQITTEIIFFFESKPLIKVEV